MQAVETQTAEADFFLDNIQGYIGEAMLVLDWESEQNAQWGNPYWCKEFCDRVYERTGINPVVYVQIVQLIKWQI